jgi:uncharacterized protein (DUF1501 family)
MSSRLFDRRYLLQTIGAGVAVTGISTRFAHADEPAKRPSGGKVLVVVFQRGAADGMSMVVPYKDQRYYQYRPTIAIAPPGHGSDAALPLDTSFGLHPALAPLLKLYKSGKLALVHSVGSPDRTRSHFDAQDFVETGTPGTRSTEDGWLNRALSAKEPGQKSPFRAVALQPNLPRILSGSAPALAIASLADFRVQPRGMGGVGSHDFEQMYQGSVDQVLKGTASEAFDAMEEMRKIGLGTATSNVTYPNAPIGKRLQQIAQLIRADAGLEVAVTECGGWDTHAGQGDAQGQLAKRLGELADSLAAFATDLDKRLDDVCVVTVTEFGRTVHENGTKGTDHGHGSVMIVMGGRTHGAKVYGKWKGLGDDQLFEGRDLAATTDHRDVFSEVLRAHLGHKELDKVFPEYKAARVGLFG